MSVGEPDEGLSEADDALTDEFAKFDAMLARSSAVIDSIIDNTPIPPKPTGTDPLIYDPDWDEQQRLQEWQTVFDDSERLPAILRAALLLDSWNQLQVLQHLPWLGRQLVASFLRREATTPAYLLAINVGLRAVPRERRQSRHQTARLRAILDAFQLAAEIGVKEHDRLVLAKAQLERRLANKRSNSKLPQLIDLVLARPAVSANMIAREIQITPQAALGLASELHLREVTGRTRYRAWSLL